MKDGKGTLYEKEFNIYVFETLDRTDFPTNTHATAQKRHIIIQKKILFALQCGVSFDVVL